MVAIYREELTKDANGNIKVAEQGFLVDGDKHLQVDVLSQPAGGGGVDKLTLVPLVLSGNNVNYRVISGTWSQTGLAAGLTVGSLFSSGNGASIEVDFYGTEVYLVGYRGTESGQLDLIIDGVPALSGIDLYVTPSRYKQVLAHITGLVLANHTLRVTINGKNPLSSGYSAFLDGILLKSSEFVGLSELKQETYILGTANVAVTNAITVSSIQNTVTVKGGVWNAATSFWNNIAVAINGLSNAVLMQGCNNLRILVNVSAATEITVQHSADNVNWYDSEVLSFTGAGTKSIVVQAYLYVRLKSSQAATITAGYLNNQ
ncbi:MAG: hypothetical protein ACYC0N_00595 [Carboxydocellales bacterium]